MAKTKTHPELEDAGFDLEIKKVDGRRQMGGCWVSGTINGYRFEALVFPEHADREDYELGRSKISKLWLAKLSNKQTVFNFDRGLDMPAPNLRVQATVDFLCGGLADLIHGAG